MKPIAIFALIAAWFAVSSTAVAEPKSQYGDFSAAADSHQAYLDYINGLEMIQVEAGAELQQALVAFSVSGNDSLAATFYLRGGVDKPDKIQQIKELLERTPSPEEMAELNAKLKMLKEAGIDISSLIPEPIPDAGDTPLAILKTQHRQNLDMKGLDYFFGNISFFDSKYSVFELQGEYESYVDYIKTHGLLPMGYMGSFPMGKEIEEALQVWRKVGGSPIHVHLCRA